MTASEKKGGQTVAKTSEYYDAQIKALKEEQSQNATNRAEFVKYQTQIDAAEKARRRLTGELTKEEKKAQKDADKVGPFGSISYWENIAKKADEIIQKTPTTELGKIAQQNAIKLDAERKAEDARKLATLKSFDEELADKKQKYAVYQRFVEAYGKASADSQFEVLLKSGQSYVDYLNAQIAKIEEQGQRVGGLNEKETTNLDSLQEEKKAALGAKSNIDLFTESLGRAKLEAGALSDYLVVLNEKQNALSTTDASPDANDRRRIVAEEIVQTQNQLQDQLKQYLVSYAGSEQQQTSIRKQYSELRSELDKKYLNNRGTEYQRALSVINAGEEDAILSFQRSQLEQTQEYKNTTKVILQEGDKRLKIEIANQEKLVAEAKRRYGVESELYKEQLVKLNNLNTQAGGTPYQKLIGQYSRYIGEFGQALSQVEGPVGELGKMLLGVAGSLDLVSQAFKENLSKSEAYAIGIQGVVGLIGALTSASEQRKKAQDDFNQSLVNRETEEYNLLLKEQIDLQAKNRDNIFVRDYAQEITDDLTNYNTALQEYQKSLQKLNEGKAKAGLKNVIDNNDALKLIGSGAATGAAIGAIAGPAGAAIGAAIGGIVGGITSLFGGATKKADVFTGLLQEYPELLTKGKDGVLGLNTALAQTLIDQNLVDDKTKQLLQSTLDWQKSVEEARKAIQDVVKELAGGLGNDLRNSLVAAFEDGSSAADAFGKSVSSTLEGILSNLLFNQVFAKEFKTLSDELENSFATDGVITDDFARFYAKAGDLTKQFNDSLTAAQQEAAKSGLSIFAQKNNGGSGPAGNSTQTTIKGITSDEANVIAGQMNAIRIGQADTNGLVRQQLAHLSVIATNSAYLKYLESIDRKLDNDSFRSQGGIPR